MEMSSAVLPNDTELHTFLHGQRPSHMASTFYPQLRFMAEQLIGVHVVALLPSSWHLATSDAALTTSCFFSFTFGIMSS